MTKRHDYFTYRHLVTFAETNLVGNVYFAHYADWQGKCREHFLIEHAPSVVQELFSGRLALVTMQMEISYLDECFAGDQIEIRMRKSGAESKHRVTMDFEYARDGATVALGRQTAASMRRNAEGGYEPCPLPTELLNALATFSHTSGTR